MKWTLIDSVFCPTTNFADDKYRRQNMPDINAMFNQLSHCNIFLTVTKGLYWPATNHALYLGWKHCTIYATYQEVNRDKPRAFIASIIDEKYFK